MTETILPYDRGIVAQITPWNCGPASAQIALDIRGIKRDEAALAREMGTDQGGTDHIGQVARVLNAHAPGGGWQVVEMPNDPPDQAQRDRLWDHLTRSIDAGWGIVANIVAPPGNYPRAVPPSTVNLAYGGSVVYHYLAVAGWSDDGPRRVWLADPGFRPFGCWISFDQLCTLIPPKGFAWPAAAANAAQSTTPPAPASSAGPVFGIDVSNHQGAFDFARAAAEGYLFATHKVVEGTGYRDPFWPRAKTEMGEHFPGRFGGYVFCRTNTDPQAEADFMLTALGDHSIPVQIDYEDTTNGGSGRDLAARVRAYRDRGIRLLPVYLPRWYWRDHMGAPDLSFLADIGMWNSNYVTGTGYGSALYQPDSTGWQGFGGADVKILQFTDKAVVAGQHIDANAAANETALNHIFQEDTMGFTDQDRTMLRYVYEQLGPKLPGWGDDSSMGTTAEGVELTVRDGLAELKRIVEGGGGE